MSKKTSKVLEAGPFEILFQGVATARMLDFLIASQEWDYSETDIAKNAGVSKRTVQRELQRLLDSKLIRKSRPVGNAKMYQLNKPYRTALSAEKFALELARERIHKRIPTATKQIATAPKIKA
jgi:predicted AAA+ superfamily ATPase